MKKEDLINQLALLPDGAEVYVKNNDRISEPYLCFYEVEAQDRPLHLVQPATNHTERKLVAYIETFLDVLGRGPGRIPAELQEELVMALSQPCHERRTQVCHHGRNIMSTCQNCDIEEEE